MHYILQRKMGDITEGGITEHNITRSVQEEFVYFVIQQLAAFAVIIKMPIKVSHRQEHLFMPLSPFLRLGKEYPGSFPNLSMT